MKLTTTWARGMVGIGVMSLFVLACNITDQIAEALATPTPTATATRVRLPTITPDPAMPTPLPGRTKGDPNAKVTLVEYSDFQ